MKELIIKTLIIVLYNTIVFLMVYALSIRLIKFYDRKLKYIIQKLKYIIHNIKYTIRWYRMDIKEFNKLWNENISYSKLRRTRNGGRTYCRYILVNRIYAYRRIKSRFCLKGLFLYVWNTETNKNGWKSYYLVRAGLIDSIKYRLKSGIWKYKYEE